MVEGPVLPGEGLEVIRRYVRALSSDRPWVILKWAMSIDGRISPASGKGGAISGDRALGETHELRGRCDAVAVGAGTVEVDDPLLTCRITGGPPDGRPQPLRVVFDSGLRIRRESRLVRDARNSPVLVVCARAEPGRRNALESAGVEVLVAEGLDGRVDIGYAIRALKARGIHRMLVEGGATTHGAFLRAGLADQVTAVVTPIVLGGDDAVPAVRGTGFGSIAVAPRLEEVSWRKVGDDLVLHGYVAGAAP